MFWDSHNMSFISDQKQEIPLKNKRKKTFSVKIKSALKIVSIYLPCKSFVLHIAAHNLLSSFRYVITVICLSVCLLLLPLSLNTGNH